MLTNALQQLDKVLADPYGVQVEQFMFELICGLAQEKHVDAAIAAAAARPIPVPTQGLLEIVFKSANELKEVRGHADLLAKMARRESVRILLRLESGGGKTPISPNQARTHRKRIMNAPVIAMPGIQVAKMRLSQPLLEVLFDFIENPDRACGVVELATQSQLIITESSAQMILQGDYARLMSEGSQDVIRDRVAQATSLKREDYFFPPDLEEFNRVTRQELEANNPGSSRELTWRGQSRDGSWVSYTHLYRLIADEFGGVYHVGENLGFEAIANPVAV